MRTLVMVSSARVLSGFRCLAGCLALPRHGQRTLLPLEGPHPRSGITAAPARASATDCVRTRLARPACPNRPRLDGDISGKYGR